MFTFPSMFTVKQTMPSAHKLENVEEAVEKEVSEVLKNYPLQPGANIAVTAGSRGILNIDLITKAVCQRLKAAGYNTFILPSMGSHGGAKAEGQVAILHDLGITEQTMGVPIKSTMDVVSIGETPKGIPVFVNKYAAEADAIVLINRVKPHTEFKSSFGSGLQKMSVIGLGSHKGAVIAHQYALKVTYEKALREISSVVLNKLPIIFGLAVLENSYDQTVKVKSVATKDIPHEEQLLFAEASSMMPKLPFTQLDMLIVDEIGKNISGSGMDTNVIGRLMVAGEPELTDINIIRIVALDLTPETHGNAVGMGMADFVSERLVKQIDREATYINCLTACSPEKGKIPIYFSSDDVLLQQAFLSIGLEDPRTARVVHIKNTLELEYFRASEALYEEIAGNPFLKVVSNPEPMKFTDTGNLCRVVQEA